MGMSRRKFTKEVKLAAIRQWEGGSSAGEVARAFGLALNAAYATKLIAARIACGVRRG